VRSARASRPALRLPAMKVVVTCGPSYEPIDQVRRLTNFSTGRLGVALTEAFAAEGWEVFCFKGEGATAPGPSGARAVESFGTNADLAAKLAALGRGARIDAVFHCAALCDFRVEEARDEAGEALASPKLSTRAGRVRLTLAPLPKVLAELRDWFPEARIVGWKYELEGGRDAAFARAWRQLEESRADACVLNGAAYGEGFAFCQPPARVTACADAAALGRTLIDWLKATSA